MEKNYSLYSNCPPLASTHARSRLRHSRTAESFVGQDCSKLARFAYEDLQHHGLCFVHHFLRAPPYLIIDMIQIWAVRRPQCRIYEVRSFISQKCNRFSSSVRWKMLEMKNSHNSRISFRRSSTSRP